MSKLELDFNRINKIELREYFAGRNVLKEKLEDKLGRELIYLDPEMGKLDKYDFENFHARVIVEWEHGEITAEVYLKLGFQDQKEVDDAVSALFDEIAKKN